MKSKFGRREAVRHLAVFAAGAFVPTAILAACKGGDSGGGGGTKALSCTDTTGLTTEEVAMRTGLRYVDKAADASKACSKCNFFKAGAAGACGSCTLMKGGINPDGNCKSFVAKT